MALCEIENFKIDTVNLILKKSDKAPVPSKADADLLRSYSVIDCSLTKELLKPNEFTFSLRRDRLEKSDSTKSYDIVNGLLGKKVECKATSKISGTNTSVTFKGKIAKVSVKGKTVTCVAYSPDADMQGTPRCRCFTNKTLGQILNEVVPDTVTKSVNINILLKDDKFPFIVQYNESDYDFLVRLAKRFGAFMFHNENQFVFGQLPGASKDASASNYSASYEFQTGDPNYRFVSHNYVGDVVLDSEGEGYDIFSPEKLVKMAADHSEKLDKDYKFRIDDPNSLSDNPSEGFYSRFAMASNLSNLVTCKFVSYLFNIDIGDRVTINSNNSMVVTSVNLTWDCDGSPQNEVTAMVLPSEEMTAGDIFPPYLDFNAYPKSSAQRAVVINNVDPDQLGRVRVKFVWQMSPTQAQMDDYPWIRIAQPYGGNEKGCYILPEIGEEVMVGFEHDNMEKPFVIGTLYHNSGEADRKQMPEKTWCEADNNGTKVNEGNEVKAFRTKKGHTIEFHDVNGDQNFGFIRIYNKNKPNDPNYEIVLSTDPIKKGQNKDTSYSITSASVEKEQGFDKYEVGELRIMVRSNGGDIMLDAGAGDIVMNAANIRFHTTGDRTAYIEGNDIVKVKQEQYFESKTSRVIANESRNVHVKKENYLQASKFIVDASDSTELSTKNLLSQTDQKTEIQTKTFSSVISDSAEIKAKSIDTNAANDFKLTVGKNASIHSAEKVDLLGPTMKIQGENTDITGTSFNIKATTQGTRSGKWIDL